MGTTLTEETRSPLPSLTPPLQLLTNVRAIKNLLIPSRWIHHVPGYPPSSDDADSDWEYLDPPYDTPQTTEASSYTPPANAVASEDDDDVQDQLIPRRKPGGYDSRVEQLLYENPELPILITDAGKSLESGGRYIVYTIRTGVSRTFNLRVISN